MRYRLTCLTPTLVGDGRKLRPHRLHGLEGITSTSWTSGVSSRLLAKGPRLERLVSPSSRLPRNSTSPPGGVASPRIFAVPPHPLRKCGLFQLLESGHGR